IRNREEEEGRRNALLLADFADQRLALFLDAFPVAGGALEIHERAPAIGRIDRHQLLDACDRFIVAFEFAEHESARKESTSMIRVELASALVILERFACSPERFQRMAPIAECARVRRTKRMRAIKALERIGGSSQQKQRVSPILPGVRV